MLARESTFLATLVLLLIERCIAILSLGGKKNQLDRVSLRAGIFLATLLLKPAYTTDCEMPSNTTSTPQEDMIRHFLQRET